MIKIPSKINNVLEILTKNGFKAYIVGGCVRDALLGKEPFDYDVTTDATPSQVMDLFPKTIPTGVKHGTVTVLWKGTSIEVTTFRTEGGYLDKRHPNNVSFVGSIKEDLSRRDFTVNAMAYNPYEGLVDCFNGKEDLDNKLLRAVGNPQLRFKEDALRVLRLFRFAAVLDFEIDRDTLSAALELCGGLKDISRERIFSELQKAVCGNFTHRISPLITCGGLKHIGIKNLPDFNIIKGCNSNQRLCLFAFLYSSRTDIEGCLTKLKVSNETKNYCTVLEGLMAKNIPSSKKEIKEFLRIAKVDIFKDYLHFVSLTNENIHQLSEMLKEIINNNEPYLVSHLNISGNQLKELGFKGTEIGERLEYLLSCVTENPCLNEFEQLEKLV